MAEPPVSSTPADPTQADSSNPGSGTAASPAATPESASASADTSREEAAVGQAPSAATPSEDAAELDTSSSGDTTDSDATPSNDAPAAKSAPTEAESDEASAPPADAQSAPEQATADAEKAATAPKRKRKRKRKRKTSGGAATDKPGTTSPRPAPERTPFHVGEEVFGRVTAVLPAAIMVDLAGKALAIFDRSEMEPDDLVPAEGDRFVAAVLRDGARGGLVVLTRKPLREEEAKAQVAAAYKSGELIKGLVTGAIKGGVEVSIGGLRAFAPASGMDLHPQNANFASLLGQVLDFKVTQCDEKARDVVVSRRPMLETEAHERRKKALAVLKEDQVLEGVVRTVVDWGAFCALPEAEGLEGLVHISEASHDPRAKLTELFQPGQRFPVKIIKIDERGKIWLSRKALEEDPWAEAKEKFARGNRLEATVTRLEPFGVFVQLDDEIEGLLHIADLMASPQYGYKKIGHPNEVLSEGDKLQVVIHSFDVRSRKVSLHLALPEDKQGEKEQRIARNASLQTEVVRAEAAGLVVRVLGVTGRSSRGFIPAGQTGTARGTDLRKKFKAGTALTAKVIDFDPKRPEPKLSIKQHDQDEERRAHREYRKKFARESKFGTLGDVLGQHLK